jgi:multidrug efflux system membrane fusion protein
VLIPEEALVADQGQRFVYVVDKDDKAVYRRVKLGPQEGKLRVIDEGLTTNDRIIVSGLQRVKDHMAVNPKPKPAESIEKK